MGNKNMHKAKRKKNDEFYTQIEDVQKEVSQYHAQLEDKIVFCNTDNYKSSAFVEYFHKHFKEIGLKKLIALDLDGSYYEYNGETEFFSEFESGDFRDKYSIEVLKGVDIVITNPPFSLFREYVAQLIEHEKEFIIMGNNNAITYKEIFPLIKNNKIWLGYNSPKEFVQPDGTIKKFGNITWFTNIDITKKHEDIFLYKDYYGNEEKYPYYDNYNAINVDRVKDIPRDYDGIMGVPITFLTRYNPNQFEFIGIACGNSWANYKETLIGLGFDETIKYGGGLGSGIVNGKAKYARIFIKNKKPEIKKDDK